MPVLPTRRRRARETIVGRLKAADPFELIRWLARSQADPRKALAELVQNSLDAQARKVRITRLREHGVTVLHILDDGGGVIPELGRTEALKWVAEHIGYSRKRNLTPAERRELLMQGKYGIGLLGFWAIGQVLEMRTQLPGEPTWCLRMFEDSPRYEIDRMRSRLSLGERYTEIVIRGLHRAAFLSLTARRIADYLAAELRGQLLSREVEVLVYDRIARGRAPKVLQVRPARFEGQRLAVPDEVATDGLAPLKVELYLLPGSSSERRVSVSAAGTIVYDDIADFEAADFRRPPWTDSRLSGLVEFPDFQVAPGTRRGVVPDRAALVFADAVRTLEPLVEEALQAAEQRAAAEIGADLLRQLENAFRDVPRLAPEYDFFAVKSSRIETAATAGAPGSGAGTGAESETTIPTGMPIPGTGADEDLEPPSLLPAGALESLQVIPVRTQVERLGERRLRATPRDGSGTRIPREIEIRWQTDSSLGWLEPAEGLRTVFHAGPESGRVAIVAEAREDQRAARCEATIEIVDAISRADSSRAGVPEPAFVDDPAGAWRSRMTDGRWEVNGAHRDFRAAAETPRRKLRYLAALLAKEVVLHSFPIPQLGPALERLVEVLTITERKLERG